MCKDRLSVWVKSHDAHEVGEEVRSTERNLLSIPWHKPPSKKSRKLLLPHGASRREVRPERAERRARLVSSIARGRRWLDEIISGSIAEVRQIAEREHCSVRQVNMTISLAFLAPDLVRAAVEGRLPRGIGIERLRDVAAEWSRQFETHPKAVPKTFQMIDNATINSMAKIVRRPMRFICPAPDTGAPPR